MAAAQRPVYPEASEEYDRYMLAQLLQALRLRDRATPNSPASAGWITSNVTPTRSLNVSTATTADIANVLATLIEDFKATGHLA